VFTTQSRIFKASLTSASSDQAHSVRKHTRSKKKRKEKSTTAKNKISIVFLCLRFSVQFFLKNVAISFFLHLLLDLEEDARLPCIKLGDAIEFDDVICEVFNVALLHSSADRFEELVLARAAEAEIEIRVVEQSALRTNNVLGKSANEKHEKR
jgi:hypothetical protein